MVSSGGRDEADAAPSSVPVASAGPPKEPLSSVSQAPLVAGPWRSAGPVAVASCPIQVAYNEYFASEHIMLAAQVAHKRLARRDNAVRGATLEAVDRT